MHDAATSRSSIVARFLLTTLRKEGFEVYTLEREDATREKLEGFLMKRAEEGKPNLNLLIYLGHGLKGSLQGQDGVDVSLLDEDNIGMLSGSVVVAIACYSGSGLGRISISKGLRDYTGWKGLLFLPEVMLDTRGFQGDFMQSFLMIPLCLAKGYTMEHAVREYKKLVQHYIDKYREEKPLFWEQGVAWHNNNLRGVGYAGTGDVAIEPRMFF